MSLTGIALQSYLLLVALLTLSSRPLIGVACTLPIAFAATPVLRGGQRAGMNRIRSFEEVREEAEALNSEGNALFGTKRFDEALIKYSSAAELVEVHAQRIKEAEAPLCKYLCNRAAAFLGQLHTCKCSRGYIAMHSR